MSDCLGTDSAGTVPTTPPAFGPSPLGRSLPVRFATRPSPWPGEIGDNGAEIPTSAAPSRTAARTASERQRHSAHQERCHRSGPSFPNITLVGSPGDPDHFRRVLGKPRAMKRSVTPRPEHDKTKTARGEKISVQFYIFTYKHFIHAFSTELSTSLYTKLFANQL